MSLGFEGDTHTDSFPDAKVLWLDVGREVFPPDAVTRFGARRLCVFESFVLQTERDNASDFFSLCGSKAAINFLSTTAHLLAEAGRREWPDPRDEKWAQMISHAAEECASNSWGAVVVGFRHTEMNDDMLGGMLRARGIDVTASSLPLHP